MNEDVARCGIGDVAVEGFGLPKGTHQDVPGLGNQSDIALTRSRNVRVLEDRLARGQADVSEVSAQDGFIGDD